MKRRVAIIDDERDIVTLLEVVLGGDFEPVVIPPELALDQQVWAEASADIALVDLMMPVVSGLQVLELLKDNFPAVTRILLTAKPVALLPREAWVLPHQVISKSVIAEDLRQVLSVL